MACYSLRRARERLLVIVPCLWVCPQNEFLWDSPRPAGVPVVTELSLCRLVLAAWFLWGLVLLWLGCLCVTHVGLRLPICWSRGWVPCCWSLRLVTRRVSSSVPCSRIHVFGFVESFLIFGRGISPDLETVGFKTQLCCVDANSPVQALIKALEFQARDVA